MRNLFLTLACVTCLATLSVQAQSPHRSTENSPLWEVHLDLQKAFSSPLGQWVLEKFAEEEPDKLEHITKFAEAIGIDPRTDIGEIVLFGNGFDETDATVIVNLGQSTGNLEGWFLAAPGYRSENIDDDTLLHSMTLEDQDARIWLALPKHPQQGNYFLIGSFDEERTAKLVRQALAGSYLSPVIVPLQDDTLFSFFVNDLSAVPFDIDSNDPGSAVVRTIEQLGLQVASDDDHLSVTLDLSASSAGKARQISQLLTGLKAMMQLAPLDEPEVQKLGTILESLVIKHTEGESSVQASLSAPYQLLEELVSEID
ncbi:MAG: hypothetical protein GXP24_14910 [Planctomycetes bacterium]|nr:hypothetical protein [Planctomycetota bacterium]